MNSLTVKTQLYTIGAAIVFGISLAIMYTGHISAAPSTNEVKSNVKQDVEERNKALVQEAYGKLPLSFIQNDGQVDKKVKFYEKASGRATFFTKDGIYLSLTNGQSSSKFPSHESELIKLIPIGANKHPKIVAEGIQEGKVNYFIGNDPKKWKTNISTYQAVVYQEIYPGIDLKFYGNNRQMEYDIIVKPGADTSKVKLAYEGIEGLHVTDEGNLEIKMKEGTILQKKPIVYQEIDGKQVKLDGKFKILEKKDAIGHGDDKAKVVTFAYAIEIVQYNKNHPLIIDPVLVYSTYLGGNNYDAGSGIAVDTSGNVYVTGETQSINFPTTAGAFQAANSGGTCFDNPCSDAFVTKLNAAGSSLIYSTYMGGGNSDVGSGIAVDASGNAYVTGGTTSLNFPTTPGAFQAANGGGTCFDNPCSDAFVTKLNAAGSSLIYSTYLGGNESNYEQATGIAVDASGNAYVTGYTSSTNFPTASPFQAANGGGQSDAFVTKLNAAGTSLIYSTYLGGSNYDAGYGIAVDPSGNAYVTGTTDSANFPTTPGAFQAVSACCDDAFVTKLNAAGTSLIYSTYLGGSESDFGYGIALDASGNAYVTGWTESAHFPTTPGAFQTANANGNPAGYDAFVTKLNAAGSSLIYSTFLGGSNVDIGYDIAVDASGNAYVTGYTSSTNFPTASPFQAAYGGGNYDVFVTKLNAAGSSLIYSTYLGGSNAEVYGGIAVDSSGNAFVTGGTSSLNFPTTPGTFQTTLGGGTCFGNPCYDAFVTKIGTPPVSIPVGSVLCTPDYNSVCAFSPNPLTISSGDSVVWGNADTVLHTATSDTLGNSVMLTQPVAPENDFSTELLIPGASSSVIGPFNTTVIQTKLYHCSLHPNMKGTLIINPTTTTTTTTTTTIPTTTTTIIPFPRCGSGATVTMGPFGTTTPGQSLMTPINLSVATNVFFPLIGPSLSISDNGAGGIFNYSSIGGTYECCSEVFDVVYTVPNPSPPSITLSVSGTVRLFQGQEFCYPISFIVSSVQTLTVVTTTTTTTTTSTTTTTDCNDQNNGNGKDKGKGHVKGKCKGHNKDKD